MLYLQVVKNVFKVVYVSSRQLSNYIFKVMYYVLNMVLFFAGFFEILQPWDEKERCALWARGILYVTFMCYL